MIDSKQLKQKSLSLLTRRNDKSFEFLNSIGKDFPNRIVYEPYFAGLSAESSVEEGQRIMESARRKGVAKETQLSLLTRASNHFKHALALKPEMDKAHKLLAKALFMMAEVEAAIDGCRIEAYPFLKHGIKGRLKTTGVLLIHDFGATPEQMRNIGNYLYEQGFAVYAILLPGHGRNHQRLEMFGPSDWFAAAEKGFYTINELAHNVVVLGQGIGAIIGLLLAAHIREIAGVVSMAAPVKMKSYWIRFSNLLGPVVKYKFQKLYHEHPEAYHRYIPMGSVEDIKQLVKLYPDYLRRISCPMLIIQSMQDDFSDPVYSPRIIKDRSNSNDCTIAHLGNKYVLTEKNNDQDRIDRTVLDFVKKIDSPSGMV